MAVTGTNTGMFKFTASGDTVDGVYILDSCRWVGAGTAGDRCSIASTDGKVVFEAEADGANFTDGWVFHHLWVNGITIATMQSGALNIYVSSGG